MAERSLPIDRGAFLKIVAVAGAGAALAGGAMPRSARVQAASGQCVDSLQSIISTALVAEQLAATFYFSALTSYEIISDTQLAGPGADPLNPSPPPYGNPANVRILQAALDTEVKHAQALVASGATSTATHFYFPARTFQTTCHAAQLCTLGDPADPETFLGVLDLLETAFVGAYLAGVTAYVRLGRPDLAELAASIMGVEAEHRALGRVIADSRPSLNLTLEAAPFSCVGDAAATLQPFLTGRGFPHGATPAIKLPTPEETARVVGKFNTRIVARFV